VDDFPLGRRLRWARRAKDLTQQQLAERSGINSVTISRLESGDAAHAYARTVRDLAKALEVSTDYLMGLTDESGIESELEATEPATLPG
jgi:transcriptional regulator with XRE-family HTH domain